MAYDISFNEEDFNEKIGFLEEAILEMESKLTTGQTLDKTNVKPFMKDLENLVRTLEVLQTYKGMFEQDLIEIRKVGDGLIDQDEALSKHDVQDGN